VSLSELFTAHLRAPTRRARELVAALETAGLANEARAYEAWCDGAREIAATGAWFRRRVVIATRPPQATTGDMWFDICELALMVHAGRAWLATRPTAHWQMRGFLDVSARAPREVQVAPPYHALDPERIVAGDERERCTQLTEGEAHLYAWWFRKVLPHLFDWQSAVASLPTGVMRELWYPSSKEWTTSKVAGDEGARVFVTPSTIDWDPDEVVESELPLPEWRRGMIRGELTRDREIGFRTAVLPEIGLLETVSAWWMIPEPVRLESLLDRDAFR
jgi:hypothetical protein